MRRLGDYTVKKVSDIPVPNSPWAGIIKSFPPRASLASDIPVGDGNVPFSTVYAGMTVMRNTRGAHSVAGALHCVGTIIVMKRGGGEITQ